MKNETTMFKRQLKNIKFTFLSSEQIPEQSVVEVLHRKIPNMACDNLDNTLYNLKMGTIKKGRPCATCSLDFSRLCNICAEAVEGS